MPILCLLVPDAALSGAIAEQLNKAALGDVRDISDVAGVGDEPDTYVIFDEAVADKKNLKALQAGQNKKRIFFLGTPKGEWNESSITETFEKPLRLGHLLARIHFYTKTTSRFGIENLIFGPYRFEPQNRQVVNGEGALIRLTEKETALLSYIAQSDKAVTRDELLAAIWGYDARIDTHTLETHLYQLRRKLDPQNTGANWLVNEQGAYRLNREGAAT